MKDFLYTMEVQDLDYESKVYCGEMIMRPSLPRE